MEIVALSSSDRIALGALVVASLALLVSIISAISGHRSATSSKRSADASERSAAAAERGVALDERQEQRLVQEAERAAVVLRLVKIDSSYAESVAARLVNSGTRTAYDVHVALPPDTQTFGSGPPEGVTIEAGRHVEIEVNMLPALRHVPVEVRWRTTPNGQEHRRPEMWPL